MASSILYVTLLLCNKNCLFLIVLVKVSRIGIVPRKEINELENLDNVFSYYVMNLD